MTATGTNQYTNRPVSNVLLPPTISLLNIPLSSISMPQTLDIISSSIHARQGGWVITPNLDIFRRLYRDREFAALCEPATLRLADGMPLIWASKLRGTPLPGRVPGSDLIWTLSARAAAEGHSVFFLGGNPGTADAAAATLRAKHPALRVAGTLCPEMGFEKSEATLERVCDSVISAAPDIVYVALGSPKQELLIRRLRPLLPNAWFLGIGVSFSFVSGEIKRAPKWMQNLGLEWVHRLVQEPGRLAKRYLIDGLPFAVVLLSRSLVDRFSGRAGSSVGVAPASTGSSFPEHP